MFSGKTEELIRLLKRAVIAEQTVQVFKPALDTRQSNVWSRSGTSIEAIPLARSTLVWDELKEETQVIGFDEVQFFDPELGTVVSELARRGKRVICAGLDLDFRGEPFATTAHLLAIATHIHKPHAICMRCKQASGTRTFRREGGEDRVQIGDREYEALCLSCFYTAT